MSDAPAALHPALVRYSRGEISSLRAAGIMGDDVSPSEVIVWTKQAGLPLPRPPPEVERRQLEHARAIFGLPKR